MRRMQIWSGRRGGLRPTSLKVALICPATSVPVAAAEARRELSKLLVAGRLSQALEPKAKQPAALLPLLHVAQALGAPAQAIRGGPGLLPALARPSARIAGKRGPAGQLDERARPFF